MTANEPQPAAPPGKPRWYRLTPDRLVVGLLAVEGFLVLSEWCDWFAFNGQTWTVLIALAAVGVTLLLMLLWFVVAMLFRRRFQYDLRSLMLVVVAVAVPCSWVAVEMRQERKQKMAEWALAKEGGMVFGEPTWLGKLLRDNSLVSVAEVRLSLLPVTDTGLVHLRRLTQLHRLWLDSPKITDAGLVHLEGLRELQSLWLDSPGITDAGLVHLEGLKQLNVLVLDGSKVTDQGVKKLQQALPGCTIVR